MVDLFKQRYPHISVSLSVFTVVDSVRKARYWEDRGVDRLILHQNLNRNFKEIKKIRKAVDCELELFTNSTCLFQCPLNQFHSSSVSHASSKMDKNKGFFIDYCAFNCTLRKLSNPAEIIKAEWIRPEDLPVYEEAGIDVFKIVDRHKTSDWMENTIKAYAERKYDGNLVDILPFPFIRGDRKSFDITRHGKWLFKPGKIHAGIIMMYATKVDPHIKIDNSKLADFIKHFQKNTCSEMDCGNTCKYCYKVAEEVLEYDQNEVDNILKILKKTNESFANGQAFKPNSIKVHILAFFRRLFTPKKNVYSRKISLTESN
jgi:hypothetical protein